LQHYYAAKFMALYIEKMAVWMESWSKAIQWGSEIVVTYLMMAMSLIVFVEVISRYFLHFSLTWSSELARFLLMWVVFIGASLALKRGELVSIMFFANLFPPTLTRLINIGLHVLIFFFLFTGLWHGGIFLRFLVESGQISPGLRIPMWWLYSSFSIGFLLMMLHTLSILGQLVFHTVLDAPDKK